MAVDAAAVGFFGFLSGLGDWIPSVARMFDLAESEAPGLLGIMLLGTGFLANITPSRLAAYLSGFPGGAAHLLTRCGALMAPSCSSSQWRSR